MFLAVVDDGGGGGGDGGGGVCGVLRWVVHDVHGLVHDT